jgi:GH15 family glucan-1,4-alpha-glucosidase
VRLPRSLRAVALACACVASAGAGAGSALPDPIPLDSSAVAVGAHGTRYLVAPGAVAGWVGGTRATDAAEARAQAAWLADGTLPGPPEYADLARTALLDLRALTVAGVPVAGWSPPWRYVWPRDAAFAAAALARTGHVADAEAILGFLQRVQGADGSFHARYRADADGPPDGRGLQEDGPAWALWALAEVADVRPAAVTTFNALRDRSAARLVARAGLPPPSSDYWERPERRLTLGIAAPALAGLDAAAFLYDLAGDEARAAVVGAAAERTAAAVETAFGPRYPRYAGTRDRDAAVAFLLPPVQRRDVRGAVAALHATARALRAPGGGLSPGEAWRDDGVSWTPETALFALAAAATGDTGAARHRLDWLAAHRTADGAIPEKVLADGSPAAVAPLAWSDALVVLALVALG